MPLPLQRIELAFDQTCADFLEGCGCRVLSFVHRVYCHAACQNNNVSCGAVDFDGDSFDLLVVDVVGIDLVTEDLYNSFCSSVALVFCIVVIAAGMNSHGGFSIVAPYDCTKRMTTSDAVPPSDWVTTFKTPNSHKHEKTDA